MENEKNARCAETTDRLQQAAKALKQMNAAVEQMSAERNEPIAVVGVACRLPGGATDPEKYWSLLREGKDAVIPLPPERWDIDTLYDPDPEVPGRTYVKTGGYVPEMALCDAQFFGISPREAQSLEPQQRVLLEVSWEALEHAGLSPTRLKGSRSGVFVGASNVDYGQNTLFGQELTSIDGYMGTGAGQSLLAGRISYLLGWHGPSLVVDTACSSSLVSLHMAILALRRKECDLALAGGVNLVAAPQVAIFFSKLRALSSDGRCKTFDASADGYGRGEGCGMIALKRMSDAQANGDRILALLRGSAVNHGGASGGVTVPHGPSQTDVIERALADAQLAPQDVDYLEAHGTGTPLGDPIEIHALVQAIARHKSPSQPLIVGSAKTNIGHLESAAGVAGVIKVILSLQHEKIPRHLHFSKWNPNINLDGAALELPLEARSWPRSDRPRVAGISSFGISGTNAHVIVSESPLEDEPAAVSSNAPYLLTLSARTESSLREVANRYFCHLKREEIRIEDVCATANVGRAHLDHRVGMLAKDLEQLTGQLEAFATGNNEPATQSGHRRAGHRPRVAFLFTGQGSQSVGMARTLYDTQPVFRAALEECDRLLRPHMRRPMLAVLYPEQPADSDLIHQTAFTQPVLFSVEWALFALWKSWGVRPDAVLGHSVGEIVASCAAGALSLEDGLKFVARRGQIMQEAPSGGSMVAVFASEPEVHQALVGRESEVSIAAVNGPKHTVISGTSRAVAAVVAIFERRGVALQRLQVSHAFHSPMMDELTDSLRSAAAQLRYHRPETHLVSNLTGKVVLAGEMDAAYWCRHARQPVQFVNGFQAARQLGCDTFIEVGPHPVLCALGRSCGKDADLAFLPSLRRNRSDSEQLLGSLIQYYTQGGEIDWEAFQSQAGGKRIALPLYPFERNRIWVRRALPYGATASGIKAPDVEESESPLLGRRVETAARDWIYESRPSPSSPAWLLDHSILGKVVFPATGYWEMALEAMAETWPGREMYLSAVSMEEPLILDGDHASEVQLVIEPAEGDSGGRLSIWSRRNEGSATSWRCHVRATVVNSLPERPQPIGLETIRRRCSESVEVSTLYSRMRACGMDYGPSFLGMQTLHRGGGECLAKIALPEKVGLTGPEPNLHPALLDAALQTLGAAIADVGPDETFLPVGLEGLAVYAPLGAEATCHARLRETREGLPNEILEGDVRLLDESGGCVVEVLGVRLRRTSVPAVRHALSNEAVRSWHQTVWRLSVPVESGEFSALGNWLLLEDGAGVGEAWAGMIESQGGTVHRLSSSRAGELPRVLSSVLDRTDFPFRGAVHLWSLDANESKPGEAQELVCGAALALTQGLLSADRGDAGLYLVTRGSQAVTSAGSASNAAQAPLWGFGRVVISEQPTLKTILIDLDPAPYGDGSKQLFQAISAPTAEPQLAFRDGLQFCPRLVATQPTGTRSGRTENLQLQIQERGVLDNLRFESMPIPVVPNGGVLLRVQATGLNFRDVLNALGMYPGDPGPLGGECAGEVISVGEGVSTLRSGQRVIAIAPGSFASTVVVSASLVAPIVESMTYSDAVTLPIAFLTAQVALERLAQIRQGERVLVHAGAGGVGLAAIQVAQSRGAVVFATAGSPRKRNYLRSIGVEHVFDSRTLDFAREIREQTSGEGVDVVLNSLAGAAIEKGLALLRAGGRFIEIGKVDVWSSERLTREFPGVRYETVALDDMTKAEPERMGAMLRKLVRSVELGELSPLPSRRFSFDETTDAFRFMQRAQHIGKVVVEGPVALPPSLPRKDGTYLITGGTGALGLRVAAHLAACGAGCLVLMARSEPSDDALRAMASIAESGARVEAMVGNVCSAQSLNAVLVRIQGELPTLRGVVHAAGVLRDSLVTELTPQDLEAALAPKVRGAWNLHHATASLTLDFFVLFSSAASVLGSAGQANYAAGNAYLDALAHARRSVGLAAVSVGWGPWLGSGMAAETPSAKRSWASRGIEAVDPRDGVCALMLAVQDLRPHLLYMPVHWTKFSSQSAAGLMPAMLSELVDGGVVSSGETSPMARQELAEMLLATPEGNRLDAVVDIVCELSAKVLGLASCSDVDPSRPLHDLGLDSLMAVELVNALGVRTGAVLSKTLLFDYPVPRALATYLAHEVLAVMGGEEHRPSEVQSGDTDDIEPGQSHEQLQKLLLGELEELGL